MSVFKKLLMLSFLFYGLLQNVVISATTDNIVAENTLPEGPYSSVGIFSIVVSADGKHIYAATDAGLIISDNAGNTWVYKNPDEDSDPRTFSSVAVSADATYIYASSINTGVLSISTDGGKKWSNKAIGVKSVATSTDGKDVYAATISGLSISRDSGKTWSNKTKLDDLADNDINSVSMNKDGTSIYAATIGGLSISRDSGRTWISKTKFDGLASNDVSAVRASSDGLNIYLTTDHGLSISTDSGKTWVNKTKRDGLGSDVVHAILVSADGSHIYVATDGGLSISQDGGKTWTNKTKMQGLGDNIVYSIVKSPNGKLLYAGTADGLSISTDGGKTWINKTNPKHIFADAVSTNADGSHIYTVSRDTYYRDGGLSMSNDGGKTWIHKTTDDGLVSSNTVAVKANANGKHIYVASADCELWGTKGGLSISNDSGKTWTSKTKTDDLGADASHSVAMSADGKHVYAACDGYLNISADGGKTWFQKISIDSGKTWLNEKSKSCDKISPAIANTLEEIPSEANAILPCDFAEKERVVAMFNRDFKGDKLTLDPESAIVAESSNTTYEIYKGDFSNEGAVEYAFVSTSGSGRYNYVDIYKLVDNHLVNINLDNIISKQLLNGGDLGPGFYGYTAKPFAIVKNKKTYLRFIDLSFTEPEDGSVPQGLRTTLCTYLLQKERFLLSGPNLKVSPQNGKITKSTDCVGSSSFKYT